MSGGLVLSFVVEVSELLVVVVSGCVVVVVVDVDEDEGGACVVVVVVEDVSEVGTAVVLEFVGSVGRLLSDVLEDGMDAEEGIPSTPVPEPVDEPPELELDMGEDVETEGEDDEGDEEKEELNEAENVVVGRGNNVDSDTDIRKVMSL